MPIGRGRPIKKDRFDRVFIFRGSEKHERILNEIETITGKSRGDILREALEKYYSFKVLGQMTYFD